MGAFFSVTIHSWVRRRQTHPGGKQECHPRAAKRHPRATKRHPKAPGRHPRASTRIQERPGRVHEDDRAGHSDWGWPSRPGLTLPSRPGPVWRVPTWAMHFHVRGSSLSGDFFHSAFVASVSVVYLCLCRCVCVCVFVFRQAATWVWPTSLIVSRGN